jgi:NAD(P)-dependent dehydrogenase (short-subunit alcohol dehydrogenase family)
MAEPPPTDGAAARIRRYVCPVSFTHEPGGRPFAGHVALVTGAARPRGIGRATAVALARGGADVACLDIARPYADAPAHGTASGGDLDSLAAELTDVGARVAGGSGPGFGLGPLLNVAADEFRRVLDVNLVGTWLVSKACATRMVAAGVGGRICNVSSQAGKRAFPFLGAYCAAKAAIILLTQTLATELGAQGIAVNAVCPGTVDTDLVNRDAMFENLMGGPEGLAAYIAREIPLGRLQSADEIAGAICWLLSDAARGVTGEALNVSAGQTMV